MVMGGSPGISTTVAPTAGGGGSPGRPGGGGPPGAGAGDAGGGGGGTTPLLTIRVTMMPGTTWPAGEVPSTVPADEELFCVVTWSAT